VRVITPGTATDGALLDARENNFLASVAKHASGSPIGLAFVDLSTGEFQARNSAALAPMTLCATNFNCFARGKPCFPGRSSYSKRLRLRFSKRRRSGIPPRRLDLSA